MAGHVTELRYQKRTADRVNVYLDGEYAFALPALEAARLRLGQYLSDADIAALQEIDQQQRAYDRAIHFLSFRPRSTAEVHRQLTEADFAPDAIEAALSRLSEQGYLDDAEFARFWVENRQRFRPKGAQALRHELRQRGLDAVTTEAALSTLDANASAYQAAQPRAERLAALAASDPVTFRRKLGDFLLRRGFDYGTVRDVVAQLLHEMTGNAESDEFDA